MRPPRAMVLEVGDWPGGGLSAFECVYPEAPDGGLDLVLPIQCREHQRSWYWCPNAGVVWCDGGPPFDTDGLDGREHTWPGA